MRPSLIIIILAVAVCAPADTIYLKNGRTILADWVRDTGKHVEYDIGDNSYAIPKSTVDHVDRNGRPAAVVNPEAAAQVNQDLPVFTSKLDAGDELVGVSVVRNGEVDTSALDALERSGNPRMATSGYFLAARHEAEHGHREKARSYFADAVRLCPDNPTILTQYAALLVQMGKTAEGISIADRATRMAPSSPDAFTVLGFAQMAADNTEQAARAFRKANQLRPDPLVQHYLAKLERELKAESSFSEHETGHFTLRYEGQQSPESFRHELLQALESDYNDLAVQLDVAPRSSITVVLYTQQAFFDVTQAPGWTSAVNDGKLRIPVNGLSTVTPELAHVLKHELVHSFINAIAHGRCPQWLHEGIAQLLEPRDSAPFGRRLAQLLQAQQAIPFNMLEGSFISFNTPEAVLAYDESLAAAEYIRDTYGISDLRRILDRLAAGSSPEAALRATIHCDYGRLESELGRFLQSKYGG